MITDIMSYLKFSRGMLLLSRKIRNSCIIAHRTSSADAPRFKGKPTGPEKNADTGICNVRNIGIMAHIDAGKTTTTERMLYYSGFTNHLGDVDDGDTVMDYLPQERERGITITSAAITFFWKDHKINLIDTPGHVDFTLEVERSLRVLDGSVAILDSSAGVEAQTLTVWRQANNYKIPRIVYLNKMDKHGADFNMCLKSIKDKLHIDPLVIQIPIGQQRNFTGIIDVVTMEKILWDAKSEGRKYVKIPLDEQNDGEFYGKAKEARSKVVEQLADIDDSVAEFVLGDVPVLSIPTSDLQKAIRRATVEQRSIPLLCGSSLKNKGVQPLLDAVTMYLPNPTERKHEFVQYYGNNLCALAFKIILDKQKGPLTFLRLYSGMLKPGSTVHNVNRDVSEKVSRLYQVHADEFKEIPASGAGNIVAAAGLKQTITGDTVVASKKSAKEATANYIKSMKKDGDAEDGDVAPILAGMQVPEPVFFCSVEAPSQSYQLKLEQALDCLVREDPSIKVWTDEDTGQLVLAGMGELHLEIIKDRIREEFKVEAYLGPLQISYKESIQHSAEETVTIDQMIGDTRHIATVTLSVHPSPEATQKHIEQEWQEGKEFNFIRRPVLQALDSGMHSGLSRGALLGFPVTNVKVKIHDMSIGRKTSMPILTACIAQCIAAALKKASPCLLEPVMDQEITTEEDYCSAVLGDLGRRRSQIFEVQSKEDVRIIKARTPLSELMGYSTKLRTITSGRASMSQQLAHYEQMSEAEQQKAVQRITGFNPLNSSFVT